MEEIVESKSDCKNWPSFCEFTKLVCQTIFKSSKSWKNNAAGKFASRSVFSRNILGASSYICLLEVSRKLVSEKFGFVVLFQTVAARSQKIFVVEGLISLLCERFPQCSSLIFVAKWNFLFCQVPTAKKNFERCSWFVAKTFC